MIRILYVISSLHIGGAEMQTYNTVTHLDQMRFEPIVLSLGGPGELEERLEQHGIAVIHLNRRGKFDFMSYFRLISAIRLVKPDIIHSHMLLSNLLVRFAAPLAGRPKVINQDHGLGQWKSKLLIWLDRLSARLADRLIMVSEYSRQLRLQRERFDPKKCRVIYNATDEAVFDPANTPTISWQSGQPIFAGCVASLKPVKGLDAFITAAASVIQQGYDLRLILVGDGESRASLAAQANTLGIGDRVEFTGRRADIPQQLARMHIFVLPSHREDFSVSLLEAMLMERTCIASQVGGVPEAIIDGVNGWLVTPASAESIASGLKKVLDNREAALRAGKAARQTVLQRFSMA